MGHVGMWRSGTISETLNPPHLTESVGRVPARLHMNHSCDALQGGVCEVVFQEVCFTDGSSLAEWPRRLGRLKPGIAVFFQVPEVDMSIGYKGWYA